jgi:hypothetical protein
MSDIAARFAVFARMPHTTRAAVITPVRRSQQSYRVCVRCDCLVFTEEFFDVNYEILK